MSIETVLRFVSNPFEEVDELRGNLEFSEYKQLVLGLIFLRYISEAFNILHRQLQDKNPELAENPASYRDHNVFWVPKKARWFTLQGSAKRLQIQLLRDKQVDIGKLIDLTMSSIEEAPFNETLKGMLPKNYSCSKLSKIALSRLINFFFSVPVRDGSVEDTFGRLYEYFLSCFAASEGKRGGEFFTPRPVVRILVEMLKPFEGRVYDPCCGSGGMFVQTKKFVETHGRKWDAMSIYGQEINRTAWRLAKMNLAIHGIDADIRWNDEGSFHKDEFPRFHADFILANPPFNISDWGGDQLQDDAHWAFAAPPVDNANFAWLQHIYQHLAFGGVAGVVLANGSMSSQQSKEKVIRKLMVENDAIDAIVSLPGQLFYSTQMSVCLWIMAKNKNADRYRDRHNEILFIDARTFGHMVDRVHREFQDEDIEKIARTYQAWRGEKIAGTYADEPDFCKSVSKNEVVKNHFILTPNTYVSMHATRDDQRLFDDKYAQDLGIQYRDLISAEVEEWQDKIRKIQESKASK